MKQAWRLFWLTGLGMLVACSEKPTNLPISSPAVQLMPKPRNPPPYSRKKATTATSAKLTTSEIVNIGAGGLTPPPLSMIGSSGP